VLSVSTRFSGFVLQPIEDMKNRVAIMKARLTDESKKMQYIDEQQQNYAIQQRLRAKDLQSFQKSIATTATNFFSRYLQKQGFQGNLSIDQDAKTLDIQVIPKPGMESKNSKQDSGSLSGGERSFATLAFIMALCEEMLAPIRAMDEFNVFMDDINEKKSLQMLVGCATRKKCYQHLFIMPELDIKAVLPHNYKDLPHMKVIRLKPPRGPVEAGQQRMDMNEG